MCDLDDPGQLQALGLPPSEVVSRDYGRIRAWARRIHREGVWAGVRWWSYYAPAWSSVGLWDTAGLEVEEVRGLALDYRPWSRRVPSCAGSAMFDARRRVQGRTNGLARFLDTCNKCILNNSYIMRYLHLSCSRHTP